MVVEEHALRVQLAAERDEVVGARVELVEPLGRHEVQLAPVDAGVEEGYRLADRIHNSGQAIVWRGPKETAEHYWDQLSDAGLTMAPLEQH